MTHYAIQHPFPPSNEMLSCGKSNLTFALTDVFDACIPGAPSYFNIFSSLMVNPSQDYNHLKQRRADIQSNGYQGLRAQSSRSKGSGNLIILFDDQNNHVQSIHPYEA